MKKATAILSVEDDSSARIVANIINAAAQLAEVAINILGLRFIPDDSDIEAAIKESDFIIADVSQPEWTAMQCISVAKKKNLPILLLACSGQAVPSEIQGIRTIVYNQLNPDESIVPLVNAMKYITKNLEKFSSPDFVAESEQQRNVFISYSHCDVEYLNRLLVHLRPLERDGILDLWIDTRLRAGDRWKNEIEKALSQANVAVLLVSADFLASDFIINNELPPLLRSAEEKGTRIIPLIVKPCRFARDSNLRHFQAINDPKAPLIKISQCEQETFYDAVATEIEKTLKKK